MYRKGEPLTMNVYEYHYTSQASQWQSEKYFNQLDLEIKIVLLT